MSSHSKKFDHVGYRYKDFVVTSSVEIHELQCHLYELVHLPTSAQIMYIANDDPENLFCLSFQTLPDNSDGVAHILEHTVLCGSKKFPVKDPFFGMTRRSLNTFMNALTGADFTCYPAASQIPKDFYNLLDVYLDAVFHPNLNLFSFLQEGHRLEFAQPDDPSSPLEFKGVVYNEMKGAMASATSRLHEILNEALFPDITYGYNSGGEPTEIPSLTYEKLKEFHKKFYHPSRCLFFFYGNFPLEDHLDFIDQHTLQHTVKFLPLPQLPLQPRFTIPKIIEAKYPIAPDEDTEYKTLIGFSWLTCHILNQKELLALSILEALLLDTDASPLKKSLLKSGLCKQVSSYMDTDLSEIPFTIILRGCDAESAPIIKEHIY
ncbi:MAG: insulinase family protein, partial [Parachlamydiaceae bacterium]|nr:insulinase family protein [Parachlamydiaceae bacterium]